MERRSCTCQYTIILLSLDQPGGVRGIRTPDRLQEVFLSRSTGPASELLEKHSEVFQMLVVLNVKNFASTGLQDGDVSLPHCEKPVKRSALS